MLQVILAFFSLLLVIFWLVIKKSNKEKSKIHSTEVTTLALLHIHILIWLDNFVFFITLTLLVLFCRWENFLRVQYDIWRFDRSQPHSIVCGYSWAHAYILYTYIYVLSNELSCNCVQLTRTYPPSICCPTVCGLSAADPFCLSVIHCYSFCLQTFIQLVILLMNWLGKLFMFAKWD